MSTMHHPQLIACLSLATLALMSLVMVAGGAPALALALLGVGGVATMSMCLIADLQNASEAA